MKAVTNPLRWRKRAQEEERRRKLQAAGLCTKCRGKRCVCPPRKQSSAVKTGHVVRKKDLRHEYRALGLCMCGSPPLPSRKLCKRCAATVRRNAAKQKARDPDYQSRYYRERRKSE